jgi:hypothetical protein
MRCRETREDPMDNPIRHFASFGNKLRQIWSLSGRGSLVLCVELEGMIEIEKRSRHVKIP